MVVGDASSSFRAVVGPLSSELPTTAIPYLDEEMAKKLNVTRPLGSGNAPAARGMNSGDITGDATSTGY